ncbi:MAG: type II toxin-antitoxin system Phd/YefM family antitoxin [Chloroflexota bacterium]
MSTVYTYSNARQNFATILDQALQEGQVKIKRKDGQVFIIQPEKRLGSPLAVDSVDLGVSTEEIVEFVRESRRI